MNYRIGDFHVLPGKEREFEELVRQLFIDTGGLATERVQVYLIRSQSDPSHYCIAGLWKSDRQWDFLGTTQQRVAFTERLKSITTQPPGGEWFQVVAQEP